MTSKHPFFIPTPSRIPREKVWRFIPLLCGFMLSALIVLSVLGSREPNRSLVSASVRTSLPEPGLLAEAYVVRLAGESAPLLERRSSKPLAPASLAKLMTAVIAAEKLAPLDSTVVSQDAKAVEERTSPVHAGETFSRDDLMHLVLVASANDAALALAQAVGRTAGGYSFSEQIKIFIRLMNAKARILGLANTRFQNPTGLDAPEQRSSARDLARLAEYMLFRHPRLWDITRESEASVVSSGRTAYSMSATNDLLREFPAIRGGKTGFTDNAKGALLLLYPVRPDKTAIMVILKSEDRFGDGRKIIRWLEENF